MPCSKLFASLLVALPALAQAPAPQSPARMLPPDKVAPVDEKPVADKSAAPREDWKPHIQAVQAFLKAWGHGKWEDAKAVAADKVTVKIGDKTYDVDVAGGKSFEVQVVLPFRGLSTLREQGKPVGVRVTELAVKADGAEKRGPAKVTTEEKDGQVRVTSIALE